MIVSIRRIVKVSMEAVRQRAQTCRHCPGLRVAGTFDADDAANAQCVGIFHDRLRVWLGRRCARGGYSRDWGIGHGFSKQALFPAVKASLS
jgi:hypothetical protein